MKQVVAIGVLLIGAATATADEPAPDSSYRKPSPDGRFIFVMVSPLTPERDVGEWIGGVKAEEIREIRRTYQFSGLYRNDGSTKPLWTVDWYAHEVEVASDGVHLVRYGRWPGYSRHRPWGDSGEQEALTFLANGKEVRSYRISELVAEPEKLPRSVSHFMWLHKSKFDDANLRLEITTENEEHYIIDVTTGEIVSSSRPSAPLEGVRSPLGILALVGIAVGLFSLLIWLLVRKLSRWSQAVQFRD